MNTRHKAILNQIKQHSGKPTAHTFLNNYLGNTHPRYAINAPTLRIIARNWSKSHRDLSSEAFKTLLTSLIKGKSGTEKVMAGILLDYSTPKQKTFNPEIFNSWLSHLVGWAEIDAVCSGKYSINQIPPNLKTWQKLLVKFSKSPNINKRRASLVFLCAAVRYSNDPQLVKLAFQNINRLKHEKEVIITKAISWLLRSLTNNFKKDVIQYLNENEAGLPSIAVRETKIKLKTGIKTKRKGIGV